MTAMTVLEKPLPYYMTLKELAVDLRCSRGYIYWLMEHDAFFPKPAYLGNRPRFIRTEFEAYLRKLRARRDPNAPRRGRPPKAAQADKETTATI